MYDEEYLRKNASQLNSQLDKLNDQLSANIKRNNMVIKLLCAFIALLLLAFGAGIYYFTRQLTLRDNYIHQLETLAIDEAAAATDTIDAPAAEEVKASASDVKDNEREAIQAKPKSPLSETIKHEKEENKASDVKEKKQEEKPAAPAFANTTPSSEKVMSKYDSDPRVRLGAYDIIGVDKTVTVQQGQTLQSISKANLGPGMECYVEALNGVTSVKAGDKLKIPKLQLKKKKKS